MSEVLPEIIVCFFTIGTGHPMSDVRGLRVYDAYVLRGRGYIRGVSRCLVRGVTRGVARCLFRGVVRGVVWCVVYVGLGV